MLEALILEEKDGRTYDVQSLTAKDYLSLVEAGEVSLPRFQRSLVWSEDQQEEFIQSMVEGMPFGALLMAKRGKRESYSLLDGQQRTNTLRNFFKNPQRFFIQEHIPEEVLEGALQKLKEHGVLLAEDYDPKENLALTINTWVKTCKNVDPHDNFSGVKLAQYICQKYEIDKEKAPGIAIELVDIVSPVLSKVNKIYNKIGDSKVPVIFYWGNPDTLPQIFENLNSKGTPLSKYEIFASTWADEGRPGANNKEIKKIVFSEYAKRLEEGGLEIEGLPEDEKAFLDGEINLFEYLFGLGKLLEEEFPFLFANMSDSIAFNLCAACLDARVDTLIDRLPNALPKEFTFSKFEEALFESIKIVDAEIGGFIKLRINRTKTRSQRVRMYHSEYQIVSLIAGVFRDKYTGTFRMKKNWASSESLVVKNIRFYYLFDILKGEWRGAGDKRLREILESSYYESEISKERWQDVFDEWRDSDQLSRKELDRDAIRKADYLFLNYVYFHIVKHKYVSDPQYQFHLEHLVPVNRLKKGLEQINRGAIEEEYTKIPISPVSNLCYLESQLNNKKKDQTLYEFFDAVEGKFRKVSGEEKNDVMKEFGNSRPFDYLETIEREFTFTKRADLSFTESTLGEAEIEKYFEFLRNRFDRLVDKFFELNQID